MNRCSLCQKDSPEEYYSVCHKCLNTLSSIWSEKSVHSLLDPEQGIMLGERIRQSLHPDSLDTVYNSRDAFLKRITGMVSDACADILEWQNRTIILPLEKELFMTRFELAQEYNNLLKKYLINPRSGIPFFYVDKESPGEEFIQVSLPGKLLWIFGVEENTKNPPYLWVEKTSSSRGITFLQVISAICTGIENLLDIEKISQKKEFIIPRSLLNQSTQPESIISQVRRMSLRSLSPLFCKTRYSFTFDDIIHHAIALFQILKIPAVNRWNRQACVDPDYRKIYYIYALTLDRVGDLERAYALLENLFQYQPQDHHIGFHKARILTELGQGESALEYIRKAMKQKPENCFYQQTHYRILEGLPVENPFKNYGCPQSDRSLDFIRGELSGDESRSFHHHLQTCTSCGKWTEFLSYIQQQDPQELVKNTIKHLEVSS